MLLCMVNMGVYVEIRARKFIWRVNNNGKPVNFRNILYSLNVIFLQRIIEALKRIFSNSKTGSAPQIKELGERFRCKPFIKWSFYEKVTAQTVEGKFSNPTSFKDP